ncbi:MAG: radical SAM protein [Pirellulaceae bacterium]|nr:radical SAM protein [Planctomycetales bacterium]
MTRGGPLHAPDSRAARRQRRELREPKQSLDPWRPVAMAWEPELSRDRSWEPVQTVFLANRECPFHCTMCDLWKQTLDHPTPLGAIPAQIRVAQSALAPAPHIKLYNAGNFFDPLAIPPNDHTEILELTSDYRTVIVENHPRLCGRRCQEFCRSCDGRLEVALGLETVHPTVLASLDKQLTVDVFDRAVDDLLSANASVRAFVILQLPGLRDEAAVEWAVRSIEHAWARGVDCCSLIPARAGNGWMDQLLAAGLFEPPRIELLEATVDRILANRARSASPTPRLQVDLWDIEKLSSSTDQREEIIARLAHFNQHQAWPDA